ncbi:MAG: amino acid permease [Bacteroidetes bacterium]|nr:amino acid permease [Bacteroidota bacterium]
MQPDEKPGLIRSLGLFATFILVVSSVIGSGVYKKVAPMAAELGSPLLVIFAWVAAGLITLFGALSNAEVASMMAGAGGEYVYFKRIYNRFFAFLFGWSCFTVIRSSALASIAYVFSQSFNNLVPLPELPDSIAAINLFGIFTPFDNFGVKALTIFLVVALTFFNILGAKTGEGLSRYVLVAVTISIIAIIVLGLTIGGGSAAHLTTTDSSHFPGTWNSLIFLQHFFAAMLAAFWAFEGWSSIGYLGAEIKNANRNLPLALVGGVLFIMAVYTAINFTYLYVLPVDKIIEAHQTQNTIAAIAVVQSFLGNGGAIFMSVLILFTTFGATNSTVMPPPRLYYAMAKDGLFFKLASYIHPRYHTPSKALLLQAVWASLLVLSGSFDQLTDMLVFASFIFYAATTLGVFILRVKEPEAQRPYKAWGYPVVPALFILFCLALVIITFTTKPREALLGVGLTLTGVPFWYFWSRKNKNINPD